MVAAILTVAIIPVVGDFFVELARQNGVYDDPQASLYRLMDYFAYILSTPWYPWVAVGLLGAGLGILLHYFALFLDRNKGPSGGGLGGIGNSLNRTRNAVKRFAECREMPSSNRGLPPRLEQSVVSDARSVLALLKKHKIAGPTVPDYVSKAQAKVLQSYLDAVFPFVARGQKKEARQEAAKFLSNLKGEGQSLEWRSRTEEETPR
jgi:hypothetical protein